MIKDKDIANNLSDYLLQINAIKLQPKNPFKWASGISSPIYCDNRIILSYPKVRTFVRNEMSKIIESEISKPDVIVGVATGAIAIGVLVAEALNIPFAYVRASGKGHGLKNQIEGVVNAGDNALVIEDLISTGGSSIAAVEVLREAGCVVTNMMAIFTYGFDKAIKTFADKEVELITLSDYDTTILQAMKTDYINEQELGHLSAWRNDPEGWFSQQADQ